MAVKKTTKAKPATKAATSKEVKVTKTVKATKKSILKSLEVHILVILAIVAFAFLLFSLGMASGAAITIR